MLGDIISAAHCSCSRNVLDELPACICSSITFFATMWIWGRGIEALYRPHGTCVLTSTLSDVVYQPVYHAQLNALQDGHVHSKGISNSLEKTVLYPRTAFL